MEKVKVRVPVLDGQRVKVAERDVEGWPLYCDDNCGTLLALRHDRPPDGGLSGLLCEDCAHKRDREAPVEVPGGVL